MNNTDPSTPDSADRFVDGLLTHKFCDPPHAMDRRVNRAMRAVRTEQSRFTAWRWWALPIAALLAISFLFVPTSSSASAIVRSAISVARRAADRRFEVVMIPHARNPGDSPPPIFATLDLRGAEQTRLEIRFPSGQTEVRGRDGAVTWEVGRDGSVRVTDGSKAWPRWIETPDGSLLVDSIASMLDELSQAYTLTRVENTQCGGQSGLVQIDAVRNPAPSTPLANDPPPPQRNPAERIVVCIDPATNELIRLEMLFPQAPHHHHGERGPPPFPPPPHHDDGPPPHGEPSHAVPPPQRLTYTRSAPSEFPVDWFAAPSAQERSMR